MKIRADGVPPMDLLLVGAEEEDCRICPSFVSGLRARSCTSLLYDPGWTLDQRRRWPDHLCYADFMQKSIEVWISQVVGKITPAIKLWAECYPLPVGETAARRLYAETWKDDILTALRGLLPFQGTEEAYWGQDTSRRIVRSWICSGSRVWEAAPSDEEYLWFGDFAYSLRGRDDTSLMDLSGSLGKTWWRDFFQWKGFRGVIPQWKRVTWTSTDEFESDLLAAGDQLARTGR